MPALLLGLLPVVSGALAGIAAVALGFGAVHGVTLGFGITLIGESVDYSIYFFIQSRRGARGAGRHRGVAAALWPTIRLGMLTSVCGFASLLPSGFPGLAQLGLYSITGLLAAAAWSTRFVLPQLMPRGLRRSRDAAPLGAALAAAAAAVAAWVRPRRCWCWRSPPAVLLRSIARTLWNRDLSALSPVPRRRAGPRRANCAPIWAPPDVRDLVVVSGSDLETVLRSERSAPARALERLIDAGVIGGFDSPATYLPSLAAQAGAARQPAGPRRSCATAWRSPPPRCRCVPDRLRSLSRRRRGGAQRPADRARGSRRHVARRRLRRAGRASGDHWNALLPLHAAGAVAGHDARAACASTRAAGGGARDPGSEGANPMRCMPATWPRPCACRWPDSRPSSRCCWLALRSPAARCSGAAPLVLAVLTVAAALALPGGQLTILHLIGMLLIVAVGSNYALFFDRRSGPGRPRARPDRASPWPRC